MLSLVDTHCHIHSAKNNRTDHTAQKWHDAGEDEPDALLKSAINSGVEKLICVGTDLDDSKDAVEFVNNRENCWASVGIHPHDASQFFRDAMASQGNKYSLDDAKRLISSPKVVAIGEVGLDYYYEHSPKAEQIKLLEIFLDLANRYKLPVIFHVRDAYEDFWPILANFKNISGVMHSFTADQNVLDKALGEGLYVGLNGIMTFTKNTDQLEMAKNIPLDRLLLETDAPYLTPVPFRGKVCKPEHIVHTAEFLASIRGEWVENLAEQTTKNACKIFEFHNN